MDVSQNLISEKEVDPWHLPADPKDWTASQKNILAKIVAKPNPPQILKTLMETMNSETSPNSSTD